MATDHSRVLSGSEGNVPATTATGTVGTVSGVPDPQSYELIRKVCVFTRILTAPLTVFAG